MPDTRSGLSVVLLAGSVVLALLTAPVGTATTIERHGLSAAMAADHPRNNGTTFTPDDQVYAWIYADEPLAWNETYWVFSGPNGLEATTRGSGDQRGGHHYGTLDLRGYDPDRVVGDWSVTLFIRGEETYTDEFAVERTHPWWVRTGSVLAVLALIAAVGGLVVYRWRAG